MRIFEINTVYRSGSVGRIAFDIQDAVQRDGGECFVAYGRGSVREGNCFRTTSEAERYFHALATRVTDRTGFYSKKATKKLIEKIVEFSPDLIHLHNLHGYYCHVGMLFDFLKDYDRPVVWTFHDCWPFTGHCVNFDLAGCERWKTGCFSCPEKKVYPASCLFDASSRNYSDKKRLFSSLRSLTVVSPSQWLADLAASSFFGGRDIRVINNGIDLSVFSPKDSDWKDRHGLADKKILLGVANIWLRSKGFEDFKKLAEILPEAYQIVTVGKTDKRSNPYPENMTVLSRTENIQELAEVYSSAEFLLNPTYEDNFPTVNLEAMACGLPVITYNTGGAPEMIGEGCGTVVPRGDLQAILQALEGEYSREKCLRQAQNYDRKISSEKYLELFREKLNQQP